MTFDPDFGKSGFPLKLFRLRFRKLRLSQVAFASRYGLGVGMIRDVEQGRVLRSRAMRVLVALIETNPADVEAAAARAAAEVP